MPVGIYRKKDKKGRWMHFRNGKIISKASFNQSKARSKPRKNSRPRKASNPKKNNNNRRRMKSIPHPSVTGLASGMAIAAYLNAGKTAIRGKSGTEGVIKDVTDGQLGAAFNTLAGNAISMISSDLGRKTLVIAGLTATLGAVARSRFPRLKLGGEKLYFRL